MADLVTALEKARAAGKIKYFGVCNFGTEDLAALRGAGGTAVSNQIPYNLLWRAVEYGIAPASAKDGLSLLCYSPLQQGLLAGKATCPADVSEGRRRTRLYRPDSSDKTQHGSPGAEEEVFGEDGVLRALAGISAASGYSMVDMSLAWLLAQAGVACVVVGASTPEQMARNAKIPMVSVEVLDQCTLATEGLKRLFFDQGNCPDQYARESRINGNAFAA